MKVDKQKKVYDKFNGFIQNKMVAEIENKRRMEQQLSLYNDESATETENESDESQVARREKVVESSDEDDDMMRRGGTAFQKVKRELKGVLASKVSNEPMVLDGKL